MKNRNLSTFSLLKATSELFTIALKASLTLSFFVFHPLAMATTEEPEMIVARLTIETYQNPTYQYEDFVAHFIAQNNIAEFKDAFPGAKTEKLKRVKLIIPQNISSIPTLKNTLEGSGYFELVEIIYSGVVTSSESNTTELSAACNDPDDYNDPGALSTLHIEKMELPCAWELTHGNPDISVAVVDFFLLTTTLICKESLLK